MPTSRGQVGSADAVASSSGVSASSASHKGGEEERQGKQQAIEADQPATLFPELPSFFPSFAEVDASSKVLQAYARRCIDDEELLFFHLPQDQWRGFAARHRLEVAGLRQRQALMSMQRERNSFASRDVGSGASDGKGATHSGAAAGHDTNPIPEVVDVASGTVYTFSTLSGGESSVYDGDSFHAPDYDEQTRLAVEDPVVRSRTTLLYVLYVEGSRSSGQSSHGQAEQLPPPSSAKAEMMRRSVLLPTRSVQVSTSDGQKALSERPVVGAALGGDATTQETAHVHVGPTARLVHFSLTPGWSPLGSSTIPQTQNSDGDGRVSTPVAAVMDVVFSDVPHATAPMWQQAWKTLPSPSSRLASAWKEVRELMNLGDDGASDPKTDGLGSGADGGVVPLRRVTLPSSMCPVCVPREMEDWRELERGTADERPGVPPAQLFRHARWCESARAVTDECHEEPLKALLFVIPAIQRISIVADPIDDAGVLQGDSTPIEEATKSDDNTAIKDTVAKPPLAPLPLSEKPPIPTRPPISPVEGSLPPRPRGGGGGGLSKPVAAAQSDSLSPNAFANDSQTNQSQLFSTTFESYTGPDNSFVVFSTPFLEQVHRRVEVNRSIVAESHTRQRREEEAKASAIAVEADKDAVNRFNSSGSLRKQRASVNTTPARRKSKSTSVSQRLSLQPAGNREGVASPSERRRSKTALLLNSSQLGPTQQQSMRTAGLGGGTKGTGSNFAGASCNCGASLKSRGVGLNAMRLESWDEQRGCWKPVRQADEQCVAYPTVIDRCTLLPVPLQLILRMAHRQQPHLTQSRLTQQLAAVAMKLSTLPPPPSQPSPTASAGSPKSKGKQATNAKSSRAASEVNSLPGNADSKASNGGGGAAQRIWGSATSTSLLEKSLFGGFPPFMVECSSHYPLLTSTVAAHESEVESFCASLVHELVEKTVSEYVSSQWDNVAPMYAASSAWDEIMTFVESQIAIVEVGKKVSVPASTIPGRCPNTDLLARLWFDPASWNAMASTTAVPSQLGSSSSRQCVPNTAPQMTTPRAVEVESSARSVIAVVPTRSSHAPVHRRAVDKEVVEKKSDASRASSSSAKNGSKESSITKVASAKAIVPHTTVLPTPKKNPPSSKRSAASQASATASGASAGKVSPPRIGVRQKETRQAAS